MIRKNAQGEIITVVLIILLILAAIIIVWQVVQTSVSRGGEQAKGQTSCIGLNYIIVKANATGDMIIRRDTGAPDVSSFPARIFRNGVDTGLTLSVEGELSSNLTKTGATWVAGDKIQIAPIVSGTQCDLGPEKLVVKV